MVLRSLSMPETMTTMTATAPTPSSSRACSVPDLNNSTSTPQLTKVEIAEPQSTDDEEDVLYVWRSAVEETTMTHR